MSRTIAAPVLGLALLLLAPCGCATVDLVQPAPPPPTAQEITGTWVQLSGHSADRLDLHQDGTATLATAHRALSPGVVIDYTGEWKIDGHSLTGKFVPNDPTRDPVYIRGKAYHHHMDVSLSLSDMSPVPVETFFRQSQLNEWMRLLGDD